MNTVWFTADQHFNHSNVIKHMNRPFYSDVHMHECLIENHNCLVHPGDRVYHLGDFAWYNHMHFLSQLNGQHYLVRGNHDRDPKGGFIWVKDVENLKVGDHRFFLSHYAHRVWPSSHYGTFHLFGHSHGMLPSLDNRSMDVGVDAHDYKPVNIEDIITLLSSRPFTNHHPEDI